MFCNNLSLFHAIEPLLAEIVVFLATLAWKTWISLPNVARRNTSYNITRISKRMFQHTRLVRNLTSISIKSPYVTICGEFYEQQTCTR